MNPENPLDEDDLQAIAARDQFWSSLRALLPEIEDIAAGHFQGTPRELQLINVLARVVVAELQYRAAHPRDE